MRQSQTIARPTTADGRAIVGAPPRWLSLARLRLAFAERKRQRRPALRFVSFRLVSSRFVAASALMVVMQSSELLSRTSEASNLLFIGARERSHKAAARLTSVLVLVLVLVLVSPPLDSAESDAERPQRRLAEPIRPEAKPRRAPTAAAAAAAATL